MRIIRRTVASYFDFQREKRMSEKEVKQKIGEENWEKFLQWMRGQTCGLNEDGTTNYYECDVDAFYTKIKIGYDRQKDSFNWDQPKIQNNIFATNTLTEIKKKLWKRRNYLGNTRQ